MSPQGITARGLVSSDERDRSSDPCALRDDYRFLTGRERLPRTDVLAQFRPGDVDRVDAGAQGVKGRQDDPCDLGGGDRGDFHESIMRPGDEECNTHLITRSDRCLSVSAIGNRLHRSEGRGIVFLVSNNVKSYSIVGYTANGEILCHEDAAIAAYEYACTEGIRVLPFDPETDVIGTYEASVDRYVRMVATRIGLYDEDDYPTDNYAEGFPVAAFADQVNDGETCSHCHFPLFG